MKRLLYLLHRWLGVILCLFMAMWFASGVVMMYVGYPKLTRAERLAALPALPADCCLSLARAAAAAGRQAPPRETRLTSVAGSPRWLLTFDRGDYVAVDGLDGRLLASRASPADAQSALASAAAFSGGAPARHRDQVQEDAWTHSKALEGHRPLHRIDVDDTAGTLLYVSASTGEVVRDASRVERIWNWAGAWIHWLYPFRGGFFDPYWHDIVVWLSVAGTVLAIAGIWVGLLRWRFAGGYRSGSKSPYREGWMRWHHVGGLLFGLVTVTWVFSGLMSMNPWKVFDGTAAAARRVSSNAVALEPSRFTNPMQPAIGELRSGGFRPVEIEARLVEDLPYLIGHDSGGRTRAVSVGTTEPGRSRLIERFDQSTLERIAQRQVPGASIRERVWLDDYDTYYYSRAPHTMHGAADKRLPLLRLVFDDPSLTWIQMDPYTGQVIGRLDQPQRVKRWLFAFLHSFDWPPLLERRPLWDALLLALSAGGIVISVGGVVIGWRRLRHKFN